MKFDVIVGNPPYNPPKNFTTGPNVSIWPEFVTKSLSLLKPDGFLCFVHPSAWRKPGHELWPVMAGKKIHFVKMMSEEDGKNTFGVGVRTDWYVLQNSRGDNNTKIQDQDGKNYSLNLFSLPFLPSGLIDEINKITSTNTNETFDVVFDWSIYDPRKEWMNEGQTNKFKYPCIHSITAEGLRIVYSSVKKEHFGISKVIINCGRFLYPINDFEGKYGMTQNSFGLTITSKNEGDLIIAAINTPKFKEIIKATKWGTNAQVDYRFFEFLKKDFWKEFVNVDGTIKN